MESLKDLSLVAEYYKNKSIFVTGATGFLGKALIEKLLRSCYGLDKIYILVRPKKGKLPSERIDEIFNQDVNKRHAYKIHHNSKLNILLFV
jgi:fatty acyl-CoA reductase